MQEASELPGHDGGGEGRVGGGGKREYYQCHCGGKFELETIIARTAA